jgi:hypothetical protein
MVLGWSNELVALRRSGNYVEHDETARAIVSLVVARLGKAATLTFVLTEAA